ncbi:MAG: NifB/NifX family molybdenum-iron cluster-binding protein [Candidatus Marinimicrobia bacterium]|nr:NifB/NifX family molybdenum-iron cluster-binding protein [Candidatus Neomarinimicrobiota bacterium]
MIVCVPTNGNNGLKDMVGNHFGRVPYYTVIDTETNQIKIMENTSEHLGGQGYPPEIMHKAGVEVMICSCLGCRAINMFQRMDIKVYIGATGSVQKALDMWRNDHLLAASDEQECQQPAFGNHDHLLPKKQPSPVEADG